MSLCSAYPCADPVATTMVFLAIFHGGPGSPGCAFPSSSCLPWAGTSCSSTSAVRGSDPEVVEREILHSARGTGRGARRASRRPGPRCADRAGSFQYPASRSAVDLKVRELELRRLGGGARAGPSLRGIRPSTSALSGPVTMLSRFAMFVQVTGDRRIGTACSTSSRSISSPRLSSRAGGVARVFVGRGGRRAR